MEQGDKNIQLDSRKPQVDNLGAGQTEETSLKGPTTKTGPLWEWLTAKARTLPPPPRAREEAGSKS